MSEAKDKEIERLRALLYECWPCVYDSVYGRYPNKRELLERMDEFRETQERKPKQ